MGAADRLDEYEARVSDPMVTYKENATQDVPALLSALRAVLAVHEPIEALNVRYGHKQQVCTGCGQDNGNWSTWPCATVRAIEGALSSVIHLTRHHASHDRTKGGGAL